MKNVLITGVSRGIGKALANKFLKEGYFVIGTSTTGKIDIKDNNIIAFKLDLSSSQNIQKCLDSIKKLNKKIDILINNAGIAPDKESNILDVRELRKTLEVNLIGIIDFTEKIIPLINEGGHILNAASSAGSLSRSHEADDDFYPAYRISKAALNMYTRALAIHLKNKITVSSYHPGWVKTDMGGMEANIFPEEAASDIFNLAISKVESGQFWFKGKKFDW